MAVTVTHSFVSAIPDGPDTGLVKPSDWNAAHTITGLDATAVGLGNVDNTSDANKPVSTATQTALNLKANIASPTLTGTPLSTTAVADTNTTQIATTAYVVGQAASVAPLPGAATAATGTSLRYARQDHVHFDREILTANRVYYVSTTGNNSNNGLTIGAPFLTIAKAFSVIGTIDFNGFAVIIQLADGTYTATSFVPVTVGQGAPNKLIIQGNTTTPANTILAAPGGFQPAISALPGTFISVTYCRIQGSVANGFGLQASGGYIEFSNVEFGTNLFTQVRALFGGVCYMTGDYAVVGGASRHLSAEYGGRIVCYYSGTVTVTGTPAFGGAFAYAEGGQIQAEGTVYSGAATGVRYNANLNAVISSGGAGATLFPGGTAGTTATGGQYA